MTLKKFLLGLTLTLSTALNASEGAKMHKIQFDGFSKDYQVRPVEAEPSIQIVYINFRDDSELIKACATALLKKFQDEQIDYFVILGDKANGLGTLMGVQKNLPWIILTNKAIPEKKGESVEYASITGGNKKMFISGEQMARIKGKKVVIIDDVLSTGGTMRAAIQLVKMAGADIKAISCPFTEEHERQGKFEDIKLVTLGHLPVYKTEKKEETK
jgi:adenine phosphoribosyltransferase